MLDPLSAISLAGTIVQFIDFSAENISKGCEIRQDGSTVDFGELKIIAVDLSKLSENIEQLNALAETPPLDPNSDPLARKISRWKSLRRALKVAWGKDKIDSLSRRLQSFRDELTLRVLVSFRQDARIQAVLHDARFAALEEGNQSIIRALMDEKSALLAGFDRQSETNIAGRTRPTI
ncbi:hypothetical protein MMC28_000174 [Mycoblastus sanguinarius]|nr:hypothetical protein [Mycoblastus sanguinarius]